MTFGEKLSSLRKQANMTQEELAKKLKVSRQAITKWENDNGIPDIDNILRISMLFGVSVEQLFDYKIENVSLDADGGNTEKTETIEQENARLKNVEKFVSERFQDADGIYWLSRQRKLNAWEWVLDFFIGAGTLDVLDIAKTGFVYCFLIVKEGEYRLALIHKTTMVIKRLDNPFDGKKQVIDRYLYVKTKRIK